MSLQYRNVIGCNDYYPYGLLMDDRNGVYGDTDPRDKFTGKERDVESQYDYFGARYYDSRIARWMSVDPMAEKYAGWSAYVYTCGNPLRFCDPKGMDLSDFYDRGGGHKHVEDNDPNAYLVTSETMKRIDSQSSGDIKKESSTLKLGLNKDIVALARLISNETSGANWGAGIAVAFAFINRSDKSGKSISEEVYKADQSANLARTAGMTLENVSPANKNSLVKAYNVAFDAMILKSLPDAPLYPVGHDVTHFFSPTQAYPYPKWGDKGREAALHFPYDSGNFIFWERLKPYDK